MSLFANRIYSKTITSLPTLILFLVVILGLNINIIYKNYDFIVNFSYIIVFFWSLKKPEHLGYGLIFFAGIINDVIQGLPIGISSLEFLLLSVVGAFVRNRTIIFNLIYDCISFLIGILIVGSINYIILVTIFKIPIVYESLILGLFVTFLIYPIFYKIFVWIDNLVLVAENDKKNR
ncbi:rod shape-determining protein MreD [Pelagibacterales bacterium SAG-MED16]|nr:rod shape-determining protein MreD [Pelagibacterales bacterium SAG-MED16]